MRTRRVLTLALWCALPGAGAAAGDERGEQILRESDLRAWSPESFRARVRITAPHERPEPLDLEVWRAGDHRTLVRFLDAREKGKFLLRRDETLWFLSPSARKPVKLNRSYRLRGSASLDDILGIHYARDYSVDSVNEEDGLALLDLSAKVKVVAHPRVRYVVKLSTHRPVRAEYRLQSGKTALTAEFLEWEEGPRPRLKRLHLRDGLRAGGGTTEVLLVELQERTVPPGLFDLEDGSERAKLGDHKEER